MMVFLPHRLRGRILFFGLVLIFALSSWTLVQSGYWAYCLFTEQTARFQRIQSMQSEASKADSLSSVYQGWLKDLEAVRVALPEENPASHVLNLLVEGAKARELGITSITGLDEITFPGYKELPFDLTLSGHFSQLVTYLHGLESQGMVLRVRRLSIQSQAINQNLIHAKLELSVFMPNNLLSTASIR